MHVSLEQITGARNAALAKQRPFNDHLPSQNQIEVATELGSARDHGIELASRLQQAGPPQQEPVTHQSDTQPQASARPHSISRMRHITSAACMHALC